MQTFLPLESFSESAKVLDYKRLGKQRVEAKQILNALREKTGWKNHPATRMWEGYEPGLIFYMNTMIQEWIDRGYNNTMPISWDIDEKIQYPNWFGGEIHTTHRSALLYKDYEFYSRYAWKESPELNYFWPEPLCEQG
tara:strand:+ start:3691 stop:4104 length:414 start_codon:yes stop_codon:yes gene_type:complete